MPVFFLKIKIFGSKLIDRLKLSILDVSLKGRITINQLYIKLGVQYFCGLIREIDVLQAPLDLATHKLAACHQQVAHSRPDPPKM